MKILKFCNSSYMVFCLNFSYLQKKINYGNFDFLFKNKQKMIDDFMSRDAVIIDVRTQAEFSNGAIKGSKNIPLQVINSKMAQIKKLKKPVITCCASGMRSGSAASFLKQNGIEAMNGGGWSSLQGRI
jgi:phage shock protein E